jgi:hypothetical protein
MAMMLKFWNWYQNSLSVHPVKTQVTTSGILWAVGDVTAQYITHSAAAASSAKKRFQLSVTVSNNNNHHSQPTPFVLCCVALYLKIHTCRRRKKRMLNL